jgi:hypothetical protein
MLSKSFLTPKIRANLILIIASLAIMLVAAWGTPALSLAAPPALPPCGDNGVSNEATSASSPDMGQSANDQYTAVVWTEGSSGGPVQLAYSNILTATHIWTTTQIAGGNFLETSLAFDPLQNNRVHLAYNSNLGALSYARCTLGGGCAFSPSISGVSNPQIAAADEGAVIVYQSGNQVRYVHIGVSSTTMQGPFTLATGYNAAVAYSQGKIHVAYYSATPTSIKYQSLAASGIGLTGNTLSPSGAVQLSDGDGYANSSNYSTLAVAAKDNRVIVVWDHYREMVVGSATLSRYRLGQNYSLDGGASWNAVAHSIPADVGLFTAKTGNDDYWESYDESSSATRFYRLQPDVTLSKNGSDYYAHVVWQAQMKDYTAASAILLPSGNPDHDRPERGAAGHDIMYAYTRLPAKDAAVTWAGIPIGNNGAIEPSPPYINPNGLINSTVQYTSTHGITDLTAEYFFDSTMSSGTGLGRDTIQPAAAFIGEPVLNGSHQNRLQVVYLSQDANVSSMYQVRYNGFELGQGNFNFGVIPSAAQQDSDCDSLPDAAEIIRPADGPDLFCDYRMLNIFKEMNCNSPKNLNIPVSRSGNYVPDYLDIDADGDGILDYADPNPRSDWLAEGCLPGRCTFLPVVLKQ